MRFQILTYYVCRDVIVQLVQAAAQGRTAIANAWNMVDWTPEAIASFESSTNTGPLADICVPTGAQVTLIVTAHV